MNIYYYSPSENGFMPGNEKGKYVNAGTWPDDAVEVDEATFAAFTQAPPEGKILGAIDGLPAWVDISPPTQEELTAESELIKNSLRMTADAEIAWRQDAVDAGIAMDEETVALAEWKKYRVLLMRVDTANPVWPTLPTV
ncbi:TPA: tail fiber assembly protein [Citrobacter freundii]|uniref:tail fiber assembly protein n=1 Tax=Citrobacter farmeri TaxID=67824 RepID=UPI001A31904D|nr:tail fiber assembly protein [Citrobacter farmeri]HAT2287168.1 tail fiber assembly protein [Citrobacter freundii]HAT2351214.1 tail fiber assembly protein [Citrobacter freundii]HAT2432751.1 tail fiber assembly protein [Citrobacter freundii]HAT2502054.1 tail fiber assembly protein [Citrobacter freundii]